MRGKYLENISPTSNDPKTNRTESALQPLTTVDSGFPFINVNIMPFPIGLGASNQYVYATCYIIVNYYNYF